MRNRVWGLFLCVAAGCSSDAPDTPPAGPDRSTVEAPAPDPAEVARQREAAEEARKKRAAELRDERESLMGQIRSLEQERAELVAKHEQERKGLPVKSKLRRRLRAVKPDMHKAQGRLATLEKRYEELEKVASSSANKELSALRAEMSKKESEYNDTLSSWKDSLAEAAQGLTDESPVQGQLNALRDMKREWFKATPPTRRGTATSEERRIINDSFKAWLGEKPVRKTVAALVLGQPGAPQGQTPDNFDFSKLDFYILLELMENTLDLQNIAVERKVLGENAAILKKIEGEMDTLREKISAKLAEGGGDLEAFQDVSAQLPEARTIAGYLERRFGQLSQTFADLDELYSRQEQQLATADKALEEARGRLKKIERELR